MCLERLDTTAKVLPCQHTFCRRCLENIVSSRNELRCPECRILVDCGVDDLPANILLVRLLDGIKQRPQRGTVGIGPSGRQPLTAGSLQGYAAGISASPPGTATRELPVAVRSSPVKVSYFTTNHASNTEPLFNVSTKPWIFTFNILRVVRNLFLILQTQTMAITSRLVPIERCCPLLCIVRF